MSSKIFKYFAGVYFLIMYMENKELKKNKNKLLTGFTIIELLVVVAIIAVLASIVLINVNAIRNKATDAKTKAQMSSLRSAAATYYDPPNPNNYGAGTAAGGDCDVSASGSMAWTDPTNTSGFAGLIAVSAYSDTIAPTCTTDATAVPVKVATKWSACKTLKETGKWFCVDSTGAAKVESSTCLTLTAGAPCP